MKLSVGYAHVELEGRHPIRYYGGISKGVRDPIRINCVAVSDGTKTALLMSLDLKKMLEHVAERSWALIEKEFGIPASQVILSCTHTHAAPDAGETGEGNDAFVEHYLEQLPRAIRAALADLDEVTDAFAGTSVMEPGVTFVRRYLLDNGRYKMNPSKYDKVVAYESDADPEMRTIRFVRKNKKPVVMVNFQTHYNGAPGMFPGLFSSDFMGTLRDGVEKEMDCHCIYYSGGSGNINQITSFPKELKYRNFIEATPAFVAAVMRSLAVEKKVALAPIRAQRSHTTAFIRHDTAEKIEGAAKASKAGYDTEEGKALMEAYGIEHKYEAHFILARSRMGESMEVPLNAITFGDIAFCGAPYEMFDTSAKQVRFASPCPSTFVCSLSGGAYCYVPAAVAYTHGAYETWNCRFVFGTAEKFVNELIRLIGLCKEEKE